MNDENMIPNSQRTPSELREMTKKGGVASGKARRRKRALKEVAAALGALLGGKEGGKSEISRLDEIKAADLTADDIIVAKVMEKALKGDIKAAELYFKLRGGEFDSLDVERMARAAKYRAEAKNAKDGF